MRSGPSPRSRAPATRRARRRAAPADGAARRRAPARSRRDRRCLAHGALVCPACGCRWRSAPGGLRHEPLRCGFCEHAAPAREFVREDVRHAATRSTWSPASPDARRERDLTPAVDRANVIELVGGMASKGRRDPDARDGRIGHRGHGARVACLRGRVGRGGPDDGRGLDRQGRRRGARPRQRHDHQDPRQPDETVEVGRRWPRSTRTAPPPATAPARAADRGGRRRPTARTAGEGDADGGERRTCRPRPRRNGARRRRRRTASPEMAARASRSRCPRWASRSPRAPCSSGTSPRATRSRRARRWSRSRPTRSTPRCPRRPAARSPRSWPSPTRRSRSAPLAEMTRRAARAGDGAAEPPGRSRRRRPRPRQRPTGDAGDGKRHPGRPARSPPANGVELGAVKGTGAGGKVTKADVLAAATARRRRARPRPPRRARRSRCAARRRCSPRR